MGLAKYNQKRDFKKTDEPKGVVGKAAGQLRFVVQKHAASHLHFDFRLEVDGVMVSWAVPKGPSGNPADRRLAMQVEDHPIGYMDFEGTIPKGEYGGGTVMVWDIGTYRVEGNDDAQKDNALMKKMVRQGNIKIVLDGQKLKGSWHLVEMKKDEDKRQWLLMKTKDEFAGKKAFNQLSVLTGRDLDEIAKGDHVWHSNRSVKENLKALSSTEKKGKATTKTSVADDGFAGQFSAEDLADATRLRNFPTQWRPQLATLADEPFDNDEWLFETKYDGYRALAMIQDSGVELMSRNGLSFNGKYPAIVQSLEKVPHDLILDGEVVVEDSKGKSRFQWLQHIDEKPDRGTLKFYVFDVLYFNGFDLTPLALLTRKKILKALLPKLKNVVYSEHILGDGKKAFEAAEKKHGEGIIAKKIASTYRQGKRTKDWLKIKTELQQEMVIGGYTEPGGSRKGIGALLCGFYKDGKLHYSGKVGSGYTEKILVDIEKKLSKLQTDTCPFTEKPKLPGKIHWVEPKLLAQVKFSEWTETNSMRHPVFLGLREDKPAKNITMEKPTVVTENWNDKPKGRAPKKSKVEFSNLEKVFWPKEKITKGDVIAYYDEIADYILPYLKDRPQSLRRTPDGIKSPGFFQKNVAGLAPDWVKTFTIHSDSTDEDIEWLLCQDKDTLLYLANLGCIEINPWSSRVKTLDHPDYVIFDLDPNQADMKKLVATALKVKEILDKLKIKGYVKTSGGKGIHVFIPVKPKYTYEQTRDFSLLISQMVHRELPDITSLERMPDKRIGKVYLDYLQNGKGKTMASIYSIRPREGAGVSTPLDWDEINEHLDPKVFNIKTVPARLQEKGDLWKDFFKDAIDLKKVLANL
ncbi:DNA ligase (ATP) [Flavobacterium longum]|uniref:DNA ligase D n=1 Tax=Flavobacterium longum TaxID=1299340 RepID=UPI0039EA8D8D